MVPTIVPKVVPQPKVMVPKVVPKLVPIVEMEVPNLAPLLHTKYGLKWHGFKDFPSHSSHCSGGLFPQYSGGSPALQKVLRCVLRRSLAAGFFERRNVLRKYLPVGFRGEKGFSEGFLEKN